jgi:hypothetical protein
VIEPGTLLAVNKDGAHAYPGLDQSAGSWWLESGVLVMVLATVERGAMAAQFHLAVTPGPRLGWVAGYRLERVP